MANTNLAPVHNTFTTATYTRGSTCIDFIMGTPGIREAKISAGYMPFFEGIWPSDRRGLFNDLSISSLFHGAPFTIYNFPTRQVSSNNRTQVLRFTQALQHSNKLPNILQELALL
jgi:hypothetical protein